MNTRAHSRPVDAKNSLRSVRHVRGNSGHERVLVHVWQVRPGHAGVGRCCRQARVIDAIACDGESVMFHPRDIKRALHTG